MGLKLVATSSFLTFTLVIVLRKHMFRRSTLRYLTVGYLRYFSKKGHPLLLSGPKKLKNHEIASYCKNSS